MADSLKLLPEIIKGMQNQFTYDELFVIIQKLGIAILIGALIGLEREHSRAPGAKSFAGIRTFPLIAIYGFISAMLSSYLNLSFYFVFIFSVMILVGLSYFTSTRGGRIGITTELSALMVFVLGSMIYWNFILIAAIVAVIMALFLSLKIQLHHFVENVTGEDIFAVLKLSIVTIIIFPLLPERSFGPNDIINLRLIWMMVIFIALLSFLGYVLTKYVGYKKGISVTSIFGGLVSSTALTFSFAKKSKENDLLSSNFGVGILIATTMVFPKVLLEIAVVNAELAKLAIIPILIFTVVGILLSVIMWERIKAVELTGIDLKNPFELKSALYFGLIFGLILLFSKLAQLNYGDKGSYFVSFISGLSNIDAITLTMAQLSAKNSIQPIVALNSIVIALFANLLFKGIIAIILGTKLMARYTTIGFGFFILTSLLILGYNFLF
ncbi:MAG: MgtC/SapB family protein [Ignavibacteriaceae bacterium]|jgi:uncharacterized membrane protein (DUF4010 family)|nr:MgtC/SapB family protein [Ignavibacteriaceae bacterium]